MCQYPRSASLDQKPWIMFFWDMLFIALAIDFFVVKSEVFDMCVGTIMESKDATLFEDIFPMKDLSSSSNQEMPSHQVKN
jgi:hypothetical protein